MQMKLHMVTHCVGNFKILCMVSYHILSLIHPIHRESYMRALVLLNLLNELGKMIKCEACRAFNHFFRNEFNNFNNTRARMLDPNYHMT